MPRGRRGRGVVRRSRSVRSRWSRAGQLAQPGELALRVAAGALLHGRDVAAQQLLEAERLAHGRRRAGRVGAADLRRRPRRRPSPRRGRRCGGRAARGPSSGRRAASGAACGAVHSWSPAGGRLAPASSSSSARATRWASVGRDRRPRPPGRARRARRAAPARPRPPAGARSARGGRGRRAGAGRGRRARRAGTGPCRRRRSGAGRRRRSASISAWARRANSPAVARPVTGQHAEQPVLEPRAAPAATRRPVSTSRPR